jgi:hypothetical protein
MDGPLKPIQKYASLYQQLGYRIVILTSTSSDFLFAHPWFVHRIAYLKLMRYVKDQEFIAHVMSNGGCRSWYCFHQKLGLKPKVMVFDSCPSYFDPDWEFPPIFFQNVQNPVLKFLISFVLQVYHPISKLWNSRFPSTHPFSKHVRLFLRVQKDVPKLFLYSTGDDIIPVHSILESIKVAKVHGNIIESFDFQESKHVAHYSRYPKEYTEILLQFLRKHTRIPIENKL